MSEELNWFEDPNNNTTFPLPVVEYTNNGLYFVTFNKDTEALLGNNINACGYGKSKEEAYNMFFTQIQVIIEHYEDGMRSYERMVPFRCGPWKHIGGKWFSIFGIHFYFRYGKNMKGGKYIPFTKLNITISNEWKQYRKWKQSKEVQQ